MHVVDISIIVAFLIATLYIGFSSGKKIKTFSDYAIGNRKFSDFAIFCTVAATCIGGGTIIGKAGKIYDVGIVQLLTQIGSAASFAIIALVARRFGNYYGCYSLGDMFYKPYGLTGKVIVGVSGFIYEIIGTGIQFMAMGTAISILTGFSYQISLFISAGIVLVYTGRGGIRAVTFTDVLQFMALIVIIPIFTIIIVKKVGGLQELIAQLPQSHKTINNETLHRYLFLIIPLMLPSLAPHHAQRLLMTSNRQQGVKAYHYLIYVFLFVVILTLILGLSSKVLLPALSHSDQALLTLITNCLPVGILGVAIVGIFAVLISSADSALNAGSVVLVNDIILPFSKKDLSEAKKLKMARTVSVVMGILSLIFASQCSGIFETRLINSTFWLSVILSPLYFLLFNMKVSMGALFVSAIIGLITSVLWNINLKPIVKIDGVFFGFLANVATILFFYFLEGRQKVFSREELLKMRQIESVQTKKDLSIRDLQMRSNVFLGLCLVFLQLMPLVFEAGSLTYSKLILTLINGTMAILLIFGGSLELFAEEKRFQWLKLTTLFFCLPVTSVYLFLMLTENGFYVLTLLLSFVIMTLSVNKNQENKIVWVCALTGFITIVSYLKMGCKVYWPQNFSLYYLFNILSFVSILLLLKSNMNIIPKSIQQKQRIMADYLSQNLVKPLEEFKTMLEQNLNEEDSKKQKIMLDVIGQICAYLNNFTSTIGIKQQCSKLKNLNKITLGCSLPISSAYLFFSMPQKRLYMF